MPRMLKGMGRPKSLILRELALLEQAGTRGSGEPIRYSADVFSISIFTRAVLCLSLLACASCASGLRQSEEGHAPQSFYTVTAEMALAPPQTRIAALQNWPAARAGADPVLLQRPAEVPADTLQPSLTAQVAARWI